MISMAKFYSLAAKAAFFFTIGVVLATLFVWCLVQGFVAHTTGTPQIALVYYFLAWVAGIAALGNGMQARTMFHYAKLA